MADFKWSAKLKVNRQIDREKNYSWETFQPQQQGILRICELVSRCAPRLGSGRRVELARPDDEPRLLNEPRDSLVLLGRRLPPEGRLPAVGADRLQKGQAQ